MDNHMERLRTAYQDIPVPEELDRIVDQAIKKSSHSSRHRRVKYTWAAGACAAVILFLAAINASPAVANALSAIPGVDRIIKVLTLKEYVVDDPGGYHANIKVPAVTNLDNKPLEQGLNEKYMKENKALYDKFQAEIEALKKQVGGHLGVDVGYEVKTDNNEILSIERYVDESMGSTSEELKLDTIDKKNQILISLPMLFKDDRYVQLISENIMEQMKQQMMADDNKFYWVSGAADVLPTDEFQAIHKDQSFYINNDGKLVIVFNKYEVAPGYMGAVEFVVPTGVISDDLVSRKYIK
ncbi:anti-sigma-V factor rsiV [Paenibacillus sp. XY044]|uniref:anti-sigma-V factor rsiV n=1 Tax=Paenibacillus sp. XY044 TaxID=2026089 RepID=UPI000B98355B|nr:anti-sigma-V factor rsiV [Paenibacillus sp. XY044]OZB92817.1 anti-sigma factor [Paenibacillus sp. XY044]